jgi:hypothetical protein
MKTFYFLAVSATLIILGMLLFPSLKLSLGGIDTTGMPPIQTAVVTVILPWSLLFFVGYIINKMRR